MNKLNINIVVEEILDFGMAKYRIMLDNEFLCLCNTFESLEYMLQGLTTTQVNKAFNKEWK